MITFPNCKINLGLNIVGKRPDGYHNLETVFYPVELKDALEVTLPDDCQNEKYILRQFGNEIDCSPEKNLVVKAYKLLDEQYHLPPINIQLLKHIPSGAGLGGGSSDAAFMLKLLNELFELNISTEELEIFAARLGADCAFFIQDKPTFATGIGEIFTPIELSLKGYQIVIIKPNIFVSTKEAFAHINPHIPSESVKDIVALPVSSWKDKLHNDFENSIFPQHPAIATIKDLLYEKGAEYASMSGSGSSVFGIFTLDVQLPKFDLSEDSFFYSGRLL